MAKTAIDFDAPDLVIRAETASQFELDHLPFGVILLDRDGTVMFYSETEAHQSGYGKVPLGQNLFAISTCFASDDFRGRIERAREQGQVNLDIGWVCDYNNPHRELRIRVQSARNDGLWLFIERDDSDVRKSA